MQENTLIVQWVQQCLEQRISSYRWALERLVIQAPDNIAADADRLIGELAAQKIRLLYGGSMKPANAPELLGQKDIDGGLIGGASLEARSFADLVKAAAAAR